MKESFCSLKISESFSESFLKLTELRFPPCRQTCDFKNANADGGRIGLQKFLHYYGYVLEEISFGHIALCVFLFVLLLPFP